MKIKARALVTLTVEVRADSSWGDDCPVSQIHQQAKREVLEYLKAAEFIRLKVVGEPTVKAITTEERP